jgi:hypothetical protein
MKHFLLILYLLVLPYICTAQSPQKSPLTVAESSGFTSTSLYKDVISFINQLKKTSPYIRTEILARSTEGKDIPLMIIGNPLPSSPADLKKDERVVIYIQGNIHAGEVEGKEALLMYARDLLGDKNSRILKNVVFLICPIINPDGNDKISKENRTNQNGPVNGVGVRYNGQFLDLNRDAMKAESPEVRGLMKNVFNKWDPAVFMDCHTTDGSFHVEPVTFTWTVNPDCDKSIISYMRDRMMPEISGNLSGKYKVENCFYGEFIDMLHPEKGWILDASEPRYMSNYYGLRNRLGILNENYVYADYKSRVLGCYYLINSLSDYASLHSGEIKKLVSDADARTVSRGLKPGSLDSFAIEYKVRPLPGNVKIRTYDAEFVNEENGWPNYRRTDRQRDVTVPYYIDYYPVKSVRFPYAYLITTKDTVIPELLKLHGVKVEKLTADTKLQCEAFEITDLKPARRLNQGHYTNTVEGKFVNRTADFPAGTFVVRTGQPLANVAAYLLEPQSNDGMMLWNFFDRYVVPQWGPGFNTYPVYRLPDPADLKTISY